MVNSYEPNDPVGDEADELQDLPAGSLEADQLLHAVLTLQEEEVMRTEETAATRG